MSPSNSIFTGRGNEDVLDTHLQTAVKRVVVEEAPELRPPNEGSGMKSSRGAFVPLTKRHRQHSLSLSGEKMCHLHMKSDVVSGCRWVSSGT